MSWNAANEFARKMCLLAAQKITQNSLTYVIGSKCDNKAKSPKQSVKKGDICDPHIEYLWLVTGSIFNMFLQIMFLIYAFIFLWTEVIYGQHMGFIELF